jgi:hypothetical protein
MRLLEEAAIADITCLERRSNWLELDLKTGATQTISLQLYKLNVHGGNHLNLCAWKLQTPQARERSDYSVLLCVHRSDAICASLKIRVHIWDQFWVGFFFVIFFFFVT